MSETNRVAAVLGGGQVLRQGKADVSRIRERTRRKRILRTSLYLLAIAGFFVYRYVITNDPLHFKMPADASRGLPGPSWWCCWGA